MASLIAAAAKSRAVSSGSGFSPHSANCGSWSHAVLLRQGASIPTVVDPAAIPVTVKSVVDLIHLGVGLVLLPLPVALSRIARAAVAARL